MLFFSPKRHKAPAVPRLGGEEIVWSGLMADFDFLPEVAVMAPDLDFLPVAMMVAVTIALIVVAATVIAAGL